ncbi:hypothetical protein ACVIIW_000804 [Bradyrhizobium sp. USDA 4449]
MSRPRFVYVTSIEDSQVPTIPRTALNNGFDAK